MKQTRLLLLSLALALLCVLNAGQVRAEEPEETTMTYLLQMDATKSPSSLKPTKTKTGR
jgi:hypothetical protein